MKKLDALFCGTGRTGAIMNAEVHGDGTYEVTLEQAELELERLLTDARFKVSDRQREILRYLVKRRVSGSRQSVKAYAIALDVLGRSVDFDASTDPIVRIEISRLRTALEGYYSVFGAELGVAICIPKGSYITYFPTTPIALEEAQCEVTENDSALLPVTTPPTKTGRTRWIFPVLAVGFASIACLAGWMMLQRPALTTKPTVTVSVSAVSPDFAEDASVARDSLVIALSQFDTLAVTKASYPSSLRRSRYELNLKYYADIDDRSLWWELVDSTNGNLLGSGLEKVDTEGKAPATVRLNLAGAVARRIASPRGVINSMIIRQTAEDVTGNACVVRAEAMLDARDGRVGDAVVNCLVNTLSIDRENPEAVAVLARVYAQQPEKGALSLELAKVAVSAAPLSARSHVALMAARFANGRIDAAIDAGNRAIALNPNHSGAVASLSFVLFSRGYWKAASDMAQQAADMEDVIPGDAAVVLALEAYRNHNWADASLHSEQALRNDLLIKSIRAAALGQLGAQEAKQRLIDAESGSGNFQTEFRDTVEAWRVPPEIIASLQNGLVKAGTNFERVASILRP